MINGSLLFLDQVDLAHTSLIGPKAARLGFLRRQGLPIPRGFVVPVTVFQDFVAANGLGAAVAEIEAAARAGDCFEDTSPTLERVRASLIQGKLPPAILADLRAGFAALIDETGAVAVRSSAVDEDLPTASFAGQQLSVLNVRRFDDLHRALRRCWAAQFSLPAMRYRARFIPDGDLPATAVIVQAQIFCEAAGTLFTRDPVEGGDQIVVEATWGLGEAIAQGEVVPDRFVVSRETLGNARPPRIGDKRCQRLPGFRGGTRLVSVPIWRRKRPVLAPAQVGALALLGLQIEELQGCPQDVEWGLAGGRWWIFQARPITTDRPLHDDETPSGVERHDWTSGFLDERLPEPVSPLGWSVLKVGLEEIAFREPLRMLGVDPTELEPITRLWNGHPYANVAVFEALYKLFPDWLLPEDARRFFPGGDVTRRARAPHPRSLLDPKVWRGLARAIVQDPLAVSPLHNRLSWVRFERHYRPALRALAARVDTIDGESAPPLPSLVALIDAVEAENRRLLQIHRWSLTHAEVAYSLLRRLARALLGSESAAEFSASVVHDLDDQSVRLNQTLHDLSFVADSDDDPEFQRQLRDFLGRYGHRSFSLDLIRPSFGADPTQILDLIHGLRAARATGALSPQGRAPWAPREVGWRAWLLAPLVVLTRRSARLREDQRFAWQRGLALLRRLYLLAGRTLVAQGVLRRSDDVFFLTAEEVRAASTGNTSALGDRARARAARYAEAWARFRRGARESYPPFLKGNHPIDPAVPASGSDAPAGEELTRPRPESEATRRLEGEPVSPGIGRGRARIILTPDDLARIQPGEVLVTRGADPGWTVVFDRLAALVTESGGQLSHAAVVARESGLPAVVAVARATQLIRAGDEVLVDGRSGVIRILTRQLGG